jgi:hypothetical protein
LAPLEAHAGIVPANGLYSITSTQPGDKLASAAAPASEQTLICIGTGNFDRTEGLGYWRGVQFRGDPAWWDKAGWGGDFYVDTTSPTDNQLRIYGVTLSPQLTGRPPPGTPPLAAAAVGYFGLFQMRDAMHGVGAFAAYSNVGRQWEIQSTDVALTWIGATCPT